MAQVGVQSIATAPLHVHTLGGEGGKKKEEDMEFRQLRTHTYTNER